MSLLVQKFGGTSVATPDLLQGAARRIARARRDGHQVVAVVSAMGEETDRLLALAGSVSPDADPRELDVLLATGEQVSSALLAMALKAEGLEARSYTAGQVRIITDGAHGRARILDVEAEALRADLQAGVVPVVAGFQGVTVHGDVTTLGRGGTDTTAVALAAALGADECQIYTDVDGVYTTDPRMVAEARRLERVSGEVMLEMASQGSRVLLNRAVEFAGRHGVALRVLSSFTEGPGTRVDFAHGLSEQPVVSAVAVTEEEGELRLSGLPDRPSVAYQVLQPLYAAAIEVDMLSHHSRGDGTADLSFTVPVTQLRDAEREVRAVAEALGATACECRRGVAKLSVVGVGLRSHAGIASRLFQALADAGVDVRMVSSSESRLSVLVEAEAMAAGARALHTAFALDPG